MILNPQEMIRGLALAIKEAVLPHLGTWRARRVMGIAASGDPTFSIDEIAEHALEQYLLTNEINVAYYSEDKGLVRLFEDREPEGILVIDPIDGTRGAVAGFEACVVSVAWTDYKPKPTLSDVRYASITEIKGNLTFTAVRGQGVEITDIEGHKITPFLAPTTEIPAMAWTLGTVGAPLEMIFQIVKEIANPTTLRGGFFVLNSSAYEITRLVTGQLASVIDVRTRLLREVPETREVFRACGGGRLVSLFGYDVAAAALIAQEAGCVFTDAWGRDMSDWSLLDTSEGNFGSLIVASNADLHRQLVTQIDAGFEAFKREYSSGGTR